MPIKIVTIVGARPQFIKAAAISRVIRNAYNDKIQEVIVHTGQHFDENMSKVFFTELDIPPPKYNLEISGGHHGMMTGRMLESIEKVLISEMPDWVLIYGDTNSTLAGALAAAKLHIPIAHVESGLRSFNMDMPEEINRILSDRVSTLLFCPTENAVKNLNAEGIVKGVHNTGDVMYDIALFYRSQAQKSTIHHQLSLSDQCFALATCHRAENTDNAERLEEILSALAEITHDLPVILPLHPRTHSLIKTYGFEHHLKSITTIAPLPFLDMIALEKSAKIILTDSGGVQKEAFFYNVPCITMRDETEWTETVESGWNQLVGSSKSAILSATKTAINSSYIETSSPYGGGDAANLIVSQLIKSHPLNSNIMKERK